VREGGKAVHASGGMKRCHGAATGAADVCVTEGGCRQQHCGWREGWERAQNQNSAQHSHT
jgi:hypothetical protein